MILIRDGGDAGVAVQQAGLPGETPAASTVLHGHAAVTNQWTTIRSAREGAFLERLMPGAFKNTIARHGDQVRLLWAHGKDAMIGDRILGPIQHLAEDRVGLAYRAPLLATSYNRDLVPGFLAGAYGASFKFSVVDEDVNERPGRSSYNPTGLPERSIHDLRLYEISAVTFPAYKSATATLGAAKPATLANSKELPPPRRSYLLPRGRRDHKVPAIWGVTSSSSKLPEAWRL